MKHRYIIILVLLGVSFSIYAYYPQPASSRLPVSPDEARHLISALKCCSILRTPSADILERIVDSSDNYPPLFPLTGAVLHAFLGLSKRVAVSANIPYIFIMLFSVYFTGKKMRDAKTGLLAAFIMTAFPMTLAMSRYFMLEFSLTAMVSMSVCLLVYSDLFDRRAFSLLLGVSLGLGMLTKQTFAIFAAGPALAVLLSKKKKNVRNVIHTLVISAVVSSPVYIPHIHRAMSRFWEAGLSMNTIAFPWNSAEGLFFYLRSIIYQVSPFLFFVFLAALPFFAVKGRYRGVMAAWILFPYVILTLIETKWTHYMMPALPALALVTASGIAAIPSKAFRYFLVCAVCAGGIFQFFYIDRVGYGSTEKILDRIPVSHPIMAQNMWKYIGDDPDNVYVRMGEAIEKDFVPYLEKMFLEKKELSLGVIDPQPPIYNLVCYLLLKGGMVPEAGITALSADPEDFFWAAPGFDALVINYSGKVWPGKEGLDEIFRRQRLDRTKGIGANDSKVYMHVLRSLRASFETKKTVRIENPDSPFSYIYLLTRRESPEGAPRDGTYDGAMTLLAERWGPDNGSLSVFLFNGRMKVYYNNIELTSSGGAYSMLEAAGRYYVSTQAAWQAPIISDKKISARCAWPGIDFIETWEIELLPDEGEVLWTVRVEGADDPPVKRWHVVIPLSIRYDRWFSADEEGGFEYKGGQEDALLRVSASGCIGAKMSAGKDLPAILAYGKKGDTNSVSAINYSNWVKNICFYGTPAAGDTQAPRGSFNIFTGEIMIADEESIEGRLIEAKAVMEERRRGLTIRRDGIELSFDQGQGRIFYSGKEVTSGFGLYTSIFLNGAWQDSQKAVWDIRRTGEYKLAGRGEWIDAPISQDWEIELLPGRAIGWKVGMELSEEADIEREEANIMLSPGYKEWRAGDKRRGRFSDLFRRRGEEWESFYKGDPPGHKITAVRPGSAGHPLPAVTLDYSSGQGGSFGAIHNTDEVFGARTLGCHRDVKGKTPPGRYEYFSGRIELGAD
ncbi:MAG: glycosyltransferase family 39 protein [Candidatus Omnitrophota bacterium]